MTRLLLTGCPAHGHLLPMLPVARAAARAGLDVRVATGPDMVAPLRRRGLSAHPAGPAFAEMWAAHDAALVGLRDAPEEAQAAAGALALFGETAPARVADLARLVRGWTPDLVVHDTLEVAGPILARRLGVPSVLHGYGPMFPMYAALGPPLSAAAGEPDLWEHLAGSPCLDVCPPALQPDGPPPFPARRSLRPTAGERDDAPVPPAVADVLAASRPLVYLTLGTVKNAAPGELAAAVDALGSLDANVLVTTGWGVASAELGTVPANVTVAEYVPQARVLANAALLVSQCGAGSMLGALCHGLPQVGLPRGADQPQNAAVLAAAGAGVVVAPDAFGRDAIRAAVDRVLGDPAYAEAARRVRDEIEAMPDADTVLAGLLADLAIT